MAAKKERECPDVARGRRLNYGPRGMVALSTLGLAVAALTKVAVAAPEASALEEIVVTAERREVVASDVPISITVIGAQEMANFAIKDFASYGSLVPGLSGQVFEGSVQNRGPRTLGLRGVQSQNLTFFGGQNTVGFYINDTPIPVVNPRLVDLARVEVLRGPQGTLYGSSSLGGTVKLVTRQPDVDNFAGHVALDQSVTNSGGYNYALEGSLNAPLGKSAAFRGSGYYEREDGYIDFVEIAPLGNFTGRSKENANRSTAYGGMAALALSPSESLTITPSVVYSRRESDMADFYNAGQFVQVNHFPLTGFDKFVLSDVTIAWRGERGSITSSTAYFDMSSAGDRDVTDFFAASVQPGPTIIRFDTSITQKDLTHETRFVSDFAGPFQVLGGLFYTDREEVSASATKEPSITSIFGIPMSDGDILSQKAVRGRKEFALFGQASYDLSERWKVTGGLRWFDQKFDAEDTATGVFAGPSGKNSGSETGVRYLGRAEFRPDDASLLYATTATGFRMGGANFPLPTPLCDAAVTNFFGQPDAPPQYDADSLTSYEVGGKHVFGQGRVTLSGAAYLIDWKDTQIPVELGGGCPISGLSTNAGSVRNTGFEAELALALIENWQLWFGLAMVDTKVQETLGFPGAAITVANKGDRLPDVPKWTFAVTSDYRIPMDNDWQAFIRADFRYIDEQPIDYQASAYRDSTSLANLRVGLTTASKWEFTVFANNLFDTAPSLGPYTFGSTVGGGRRPTDFTVRPRTLGLRISRDF